ncbi:MAG: DUF763 domain-containing protein [Desulfurococcaceae archaeon]
MLSSNGFAELPLHEGEVPEWLMKRMKTLGSLIARFVVEEYGPGELVRRLSDPFWFQAFNNVIGMDWDSSGSTTVVLYVLKSAFPPSGFRDHGVAVLGGKGRDAREVPREAGLLSSALDPGELVKASRLAAKVDSVALQDGYSLYIHGVVVSASGEILVVQQGMNTRLKTARRYHLRVEERGARSLDRDPHSGVASQRIAPALNLVDGESGEARRAILDIVESTPVGSLTQQLYEVNRLLKRAPSLLAYATGAPKAPPSELAEKVRKCPSFYRPVADVKRVESIAEEIKKQAPREFGELLLVQGLGPEAMRAIALVADLIYGYEPSFRDPTTLLVDPFLYAYAHGGKDGVPYRVRPKDMDKTIEFFARAVDEVRAGDWEKRLLLRNFSRFVRRVVASYGSLARSAPPN